MPPASGENFQVSAADINGKIRCSFFFRRSVKGVKRKIDERFFERRPGRSLSYRGRAAESRETGEELVACCDGRRRL